MIISRTALNHHLVARAAIRMRGPSQTGPSLPLLCRFNRQPVGCEIALVRCMSLDPFELGLDSEPFALFDFVHNRLDQVPVLHGFARRGLPTVPSPGLKPVRQTVD